MRKSTKLALIGIIIWTAIILIFSRLLHGFSMDGLFAYEDAKTVWVVGLGAIWLLKLMFGRIYDQGSKFND